ncbi:MAG: metallophosphoesterase [Caldilineaceae bacterium]
MRTPKRFIAARFLQIIVLLSAFSGLVSASPTSNQRSLAAWLGQPALYAQAEQPSSNIVHFAVIGAYGQASPNLAAVANLIQSWQPDFIVTNGDNNYPYGRLDTIDANIGQYFHAYIAPYTGSYGPGSAENRFFPALGQSDWQSLTCEANTCSGPYFYYFNLPNNGRYYDFVKGSVHIFVLDSAPREPSGNTAASRQADWLRTQLAASTARWNVVFVYDAPYTSGSEHGSVAALQWPYKAWGADAVIAGSEHTYERLLVDGLPYMVNGLGGATLGNFAEPLPESVIRYNADFGALLVDANVESLTFQFINARGTFIDSYTLSANASATPTPDNTLPPPTSTLTTTMTPTLTVTPTATVTPAATLTPSPTAPAATPTCTPGDESPLPTPTATARPTEEDSQHPDPTEEEGGQHG